jgi:hypothetical protein
LGISPRTPAQHCDKGKKNCPTVRMNNYHGFEILVFKYFLREKNFLPQKHKNLPTDRQARKLTNYLKLIISFL